MVDSIPYGGILFIYERSTMSYVLKSCIRLLSLVFLVVGGIQHLIARPISYPGGWTVMQSNNWELSRLHIHYSPEKNYSIGLSVEDFRQSDLYNINFQWNYLLNRRNTKNSQRNMYLRTQLGVISDDDRVEERIAMGFSLDWETRRYFLSYDNEVRYADVFDNGSFHQKARAGIAPYIAGYNKLHTWIMLQVEHHPEQPELKDTKFLVTPLLRFFKGSYLFEIGADNDSDVLFNWIVRY